MKITDYEISRYRLPAGAKERLEFDSNVCQGLASTFAAPARIRSFSSTAPARIASAQRSAASAKSKRPRRARRRRHGWPPSARAGGSLKLEKAKAKVRSSETFGLLLPKFLTRQLTEWKARTHQEATYCLNAHTKPFRPLPVSAIDKRMVAARLEEIAVGKRSGRAQQRPRSTCPAFFGWAIGEGLCDENPVSAPTGHDRSSPAQARGSRNQSDPASAQRAGPRRRRLSRYSQAGSLRGFAPRRGRQASVGRGRPRAVRRSHSRPAAPRTASRGSFR